MFSNSIPAWNPDTLSWSYRGRTVYNCANDLLWDPQTLRVMTTGHMPDPETGELPGVPDPANFAIYPSTYTAEVPEYDKDDQKLIPIKFVSPLNTPTPKTSNTVLLWMQRMFPTLKHEIVTDPKTKEVQISSTDPKNNWPIVLNSAGQIALKLDQGKPAAQEIAASLKEGGLNP